MSDSFKRRGTDYETLRSMGAGGAHPARETEDPLAELARLVSQTPPVDQDFHEDPRYAAPPRVSPPAPPRASYVPPPVAPPSDRLEPLGLDGDRPPAAAPPRSYGAPIQPTYNQETDFFADEPLRGVQSGYANLGDSYEFGSQSGAYRDDFDSGDEETVYPDEDDAIDDAPRRGRRGGIVVMGSLMSVALIAGLGGWAYWTSGDGETSDQPPVIAAPATPVKVVAEAKPVEKSKIYEDRILPATEAQVGPGPEEPREKPRPIEPEPAPAAFTDAPAPEVAGNEPPASGPSGARVVRTIPISPSSLGQSRPAAAAEEPPAPIEGTGVAEGMSLQPGRQFGIMEPAAPAAAAEPPSAPAFAQEVPLPQPRPLTALTAPQPAEAAPASQARAATAAPSPGGPPSSPQPQVTVTTKRPLQPQGAPPPAATPRNSTAREPAQPQQAPRPVRVATASPIPPQPQVPSQPQVATIAGGGGAFGVQLTAQRSEEEAIAAFNALKQRHPQVLGPYTATVARADLGPDRGVFYRAMVPAQSQADASNLCIQFKAAGVDCIVQRR